MKLFWQLDDFEEECAINYQIDNILHQWIEDGFEFDATTPEEIKILETVNAAIDHARTLPTCGERFDYLLGIGDVNDVAFDIAHSLASTSFYMEHNEAAVHLDIITGGDEDEMHEGEAEQLDLPEIVPAPKKTSDLN